MSDVGKDVPEHQLSRHQRHELLDPDEEAKEVADDKFEKKDCRGQTKDPAS
jgi:hypothetical protein